MKEFCRLQEEGTWYNIVTESGSLYQFMGEMARGGIPLFYRNDSEDTIKLVAIRPSLLTNFRATRKFSLERKYLSGYNASGNRTFRIIPAHIELGFILVSGKGHQSTKIKAIHRV